ncbi:SpoIIE family protein phosphatase [Streptomyces sp. NPDC056254]|uniref:SpoIIE family protein phosphatase n=1 Tax=Streptomyces sp. NPDC056254 TaxID=3345763 RepID=UPI0035DE0E6C
MGAMFFAVLAVAGQIERNCIREKTLEGQVIAASKGNHGGRPKDITDDMLTFAVALKDKGVPVPDIAKKLTIKVGKNAGKHPSFASLYRALAEAEAAAVYDGMPLRPKPARSPQGLRSPGPSRSKCLRCPKSGVKVPGHLPPLLVTPGHEARYLHADTGLPLGVDPDVPRPDHEEHLPAGTTILLHTDGLVEQRGESLDTGMEEAAGIAATYAGESLPHLVDALIKARSGAFDDDVALLAARITPSPKESR